MSLYEAVNAQIISFLMVCLYHVRVVVARESRIRVVEKGVWPGLVLTKYFWEGKKRDEYHL